MRLDLRLVTEGKAASRSRAQSLITDGRVLVNGVQVTKHSFDVREDDEIEVEASDSDYVGRGGLKLEAALKRFGTDVKNKVCADIGASTGGFTDCLLRNGAEHVYAVDAGHGQLARELLTDSRVTNLEGVNARYMTEDTLPEKCSIAVTDLSFISLTLVLPAITGIISDEGEIIALVKPQFECGREALGKGGIVRDRKQHILALRKVISSAAECGLGVDRVMKSPIFGGDGNTEFLIHASRRAVGIGENEIKEAVSETI